MARSTIITALWLSLALFLGLPLLSESYKYHLGRPSAMVHSSSSSCSTSSSRHLPRRLPHFAEPGKDNFNPNERRMITRENEGEFFESDFDRKPLKDRLPTAYAFLAIVSLPFLVGLFVLYTQPH